VDTTTSQGSPPVVIKGSRGMTPACNEMFPQRREDRLDMLEPGDKLIPGSKQRSKSKNFPEIHDSVKRVSIKKCCSEGECSAQVFKGDMKIENK